jgi:two-component system, NarL family, sensor histidine kinase FusK
MQGGTGAERRRSLALLAGPLPSVKRHETAALLIARMIGVALLYFATAQLGLAFAVVGDTVTLFWPPSGIALVAVLVFGYRIAPGIFLGAFLANAWTGLPILLAASIGVGNMAEALAGALLLQHLAGFRNTLDRVRDVFALILLAAFLSTTLSAFVGVSTLTLGGMVPFGDYATVWLKWWLGDMMGVLVVAPPLLVWLTHAWPVLSPVRTLEAAGLFTMVLLVGYMIFAAPQLAGHGYYPAALAVVPLVIWGALRFDHWGATLVTAVISLLAIWGTTQGTGPFVLGSPVDSLVGWVLFVNLLAVSGLLLAAGSLEQRRQQAQIRCAHDELEQRVQQRTEELARSNARMQDEMAERERLETALMQASEAQQKSIGAELHDGLGQHLTSIAFLGAALQQRLQDREHPETAAAQRVVELVNESIDMTRRVAYGLYPSILEFRGLASALEQLTDDTRALKGINCVLSADPEVRVSDPRAAINLYRIAQESINNAVRHSQARHLWIDLTSVDGNHRLAIADDGIGFDPARIEPGRGLGMHSLRARANRLGGSIEIKRNARGGTTVAVVYPAPRGELGERRPA